MDEKLSQTLETLRPTRREIITVLGGAALSGVVAMPFYRPLTEAWHKFDAIGNDYSNDPFLGDAVRINRDRLNELLADSVDTPLSSYRVNENWQEDPESLTEHAFFVDEPGPVYAEFEGLQGDGTSFTLLKASVNGSEELLIPLIRDPEDQSPVTIQLGVHETGRHRLNISVEDGTINDTEITPFFTSGSPNSFRSLIDIHQPIIYPRDPDDITDNFPVRTLTFVYETSDEFKLVYWKECIGEDKEYGRFGTSAQQLHRTKQRTTDIDWDLEVRINKATGEVLSANIAEPTHNRTSIPTNATPHTPLRIASLNNNVRLMNEDQARQNKGVSIRPTIHTHGERWVELYSTTPAIGRLSVIEHIKKGNLNPRDPIDIKIIEQAGLDVSMFQN